MQSPTSNPPATTTTIAAGLELTGPLKSWLLDEPSDQTAIQTIRGSAILSEQAREALPSLRAQALKSATPDQIKSIIGQRFALFPQPQRNDGEWAAWWADYLSALDGLTPYAIEAGMAAWVRNPDAEFMCKPGKLLELASTVPNQNRWARAHDRAKRATHIEPPAVAAPAEEAPKIPREDFAAMMTDFAKKMDAKKVPQAQRRPRHPTPAGTVIEGRGMTPEMARLLGIAPSAQDAA